MLLVLYVDTIWGDAFMKKNIILCMAILFSLLLSGCPNPYVVRYHPTSQQDTTWATMDERVLFYVPPDYSSVDGRISTDAGYIAAHFSLGPCASDVDVYRVDDVSTDGEYRNTIENWLNVSVKPNQFIVKVRETTYFTPGEILTFYCVDGNHLDDPEYLQAEIAKLRQEERKSQWIAQGILAGVVVLVVAIVVLLLRRKRRRRKLG